MRLLALAPLLILAQAVGCETSSLAPIQDYCQRYERVVLTQDQKNQIRTLMPELRKRIQGNDLDYLCQCTGFKDPICKKKTTRG